MAVFKWFRPGYELVDDRFEWNVQVPFLHTTDETGQKLVSHLVPSQKKPNSQWQLSVSNRSKEILMMICHYNSSGEPSEMFDPVLWKIFLSNRRGRKVFQQMSHSNPDSSFVEFILSKEKIIKSECQQTDGSFTFSCKIISHMKIVPISSAYSPVRPVDCSSGLITHLEGLFDKMSFSDVNFNIGGREFPAHKSILTSRSPVFAAMFQHPTKENLSNQVVVEDINLRRNPLDNECDDYVWVSPTVYR
jgi:speckle-type POZ protein